MDIVFLGHSSFRIKGKNATVITDPFESGKVGFKFPKVEADIVTVSHDHWDHNQSSLVQGSPKVVSGPGEYEIKGVSVFGVPTYHDAKQGAERGKNTVYVITIDNMRVCHLGDLGHTLSEAQVGEIGEVDILLVPVGGVYTISTKEAAEVVSSLEPKIVIPMHYKTGELNQETFGKLAGVDEFVKEMGIGPIKDSKFNITYDKLPEEMQVVILERKS